MVPVRSDEDWESLSSDIHGLAFKIVGQSNAKDVAQNALAKAFEKRDQFDPGRQPSFTKWVKGFARYEAADDYRRVGQSPCSLPESDWPADYQPVEHAILNRERRSAVATAGIDAYRESSPVVRTVVVCAVAGEDQRTTGTYVGIEKGNVARKLFDFRQRFAKKLNREGISGFVDLGDLYYCCAVATQEDVLEGQDLLVDESIHDSIIIQGGRIKSPFTVDLEQVAKDVDRALTLIRDNKIIPQFIQDVVMSRLGVIAVEVHKGDPDLVVVKEALHLVLLPFPSFVSFRSVAGLATVVGIDMSNT
jgi:DNA-directed RNA polymerase specialized sigma24 family protein